MSNLKKLALIAAVPVAVVGWALFRPELLFVHQRVDEKAPVSAASSTLAEGTFVSYAHETKGQATVLKDGAKTYLRLSEFTTSNGPDVRVYLVKGSDPSGAGVGKNGFIDLGELKGNLGDQNYELPAGTDLSQFGSVAIWCRRFAVGFGGAALGGLQGFSATPSLRTVSFESEITVTSGRFTSATPTLRGSAELVEANDKRFLRLRNVTAAGKSLRVVLVKAETIANDGTVTSSEKLDLGALTGQREQRFAVPKSIDLWLYRSVSIWDAAKKRGAAKADLRSDQERAKGSSSSLI